MLNCRCCEGEGHTTDEETEAQLLCTICFGTGVLSEKTDELYELAKCFAELQNKIHLLNKRIDGITNE